MRRLGVSTALVRLACGLCLAVTLVPFTGHEAAADAKDAKAAKADDAKDKKGAKKGAGTYTPEEIKALEEARKRLEEEAQDAPPPPRRAAAVKVVKPAPVMKKDAEVSGCTPGKLCTVCVAGCAGEKNAIVHTSQTARRSE